MFNRILLPLDRSPLAECVLPHAVAVAGAFKSQVTLVHVMDVPHGTNWRRAVDPLNWQIRKAEAESYLGDLVLRLQKAGLPAEKQILEGPAAERIVDFSSQERCPSHHPQQPRTERPERLEREQRCTEDYPPRSHLDHDRAGLSADLG